MRATMTQPLIDPPAKRAVVSSDGADQALVERVRAGDVAAFEQMFTEHSASLFAYAYRIIGSREDAEDIVQSVFRTVWERRADWQPTLSIRAYLLGSIRNTAFNIARHTRVVQRAEARLVMEDCAPGMSARPAPIDAELEAADLAARIEAAAGQLAPRCRLVFLERWRHGWSIAETARQLGISPKTVEMQWSRAMAKIRERVKPFL
jgi:RNA polymerase sigma-70 factor (ECF subfamily)